MSVVVRTAAYTQSTPARIATFYYHGDIRITALTPSSGPTYGGTELEISGTGFIRSGLHVLCGLRTAADELGATIIGIAPAMYCRADI